ncbi:MAG TPA: hypothetical protein VJW76_08035 [Verrucomicrobiae bacterium]|nr:hypothetical protein [Verrucomicrobiae bacterium]
MIASPPTLEGETKSTPALEAQQSESKQTTTANPDAEENVYLIGRPTLKGYLHFVKGHSVNPPAKGEISQDWHSAHEHIHQLEKAEAGAADNPPVKKLEVNSKYEALLIEFLKDPLVQNNFNTVPTDVAFVELDRLVVYQKHIDLTFVRQLKRKLGPAPSDEDIFRTCLCYDHRHPPVKWSRVGGDRFVFMSPSNDLRFLGTMPLKSKHLKNYPPPGSLVGVAGIAVGFGSNFLNAICAENRIILNNGSHRAYALRDMGFTHAPCIIQHVSTRHELDIVGSSAIRRDPDLYLKHPRPSMLKDYFDPKLHRVFQVHRRWKQVTVKYEVDETYVPAL